MGEIQIKEGAPVPQQKPKQKAIWWRVLLAFFGGFLCFPLVVVGAGAIIGTVFTTRQVVEMAGGNPDDILGAKYQQQTVLQSVMTLLNEQKYDTLEDLNEISPMVEKLVMETLNPVLEENLHYTLDWDELKTKKLSGEGSDSIGDYLKTDITEGIKLVDFIEGADDLRGVLKYILYDVVRDANGKAVEDKDGNVTIDENNPYSISDIMNGGASFFNQIIDYIKIGDVIEVTSSSPKILQVMGNWRIGNISDKMNTMKLSALFEQSELDSNAMLAALGDLTVSELTNSEKLMNTVMALKLGDIVKDIPADTILYSFKDKTLNEIKDTDVNSIYLADLLKKEVYVKTTGKEADYNKVIGALMENERRSRFDKYVEAGGEITNYTLWLSADSDNAKYKASVTTLTNYDSIKNIKLEDIMDNAGNNKVLQAIFDKEATVGNMSTVVNELTLGEVMDVEEGSLLDYPAIKNTPISTSASLVETIKSTVELSKVISVNDSSPQILKTLTDYQVVGGKATFGDNGAKIGNISSKLDGMTLSQVIEIDEGSSAILKALKDKLVFGSDPETNLTGAMNNLKFNQVFTWDDCKDSDIMKSLWNNNYSGDFKINEIGDAMKNVGLLDMLGDKVYENKNAQEGDADYHRLSYMWWFLLTEQEESESDAWTIGENATEVANRNLPANAAARSYKVGNFDSLVTNMTYHMQKETLFKLHDAGLITCNRSALEKEIYTEYIGLSPVIDSKRAIGTMTLAEFINVINNMPGA